MVSLHKEKAFNGPVKLSRLTSCTGYLFRKMELYLTNREHYLKYILLLSSKEGTKRVLSVNNSKRHPIK